jgi:hypothetical protein
VIAMLAIEILLGKLKLETATPEMELALLETEQKVRTFCNLPEDIPIPSALNFTIANMAIDLLQSSPAASGAGGVENLPVTEVKMGETSYKFDTAGGRRLLDKLLLNYEGDLLRYRRTRK